MAQVELEDLADGAVHGEHDTAAVLHEHTLAERFDHAAVMVGARQRRQVVRGGAAPGESGLVEADRDAVQFDRLLDCAAGKASKQICSDGWMHDAEALIPASDQALARSLLDYYIDGNLRGDAVKKQACS